jgi:uncharacterized protein YecT (DUF1311 family)
MVRFLVGALMLFSMLAGASFDCARAVSPIERTICTDVCLSRLDGAMGEIYRPMAQDATMRQAQRAWLHRRDRTCGADATCLYAMTLARIVTLASQARTAPSRPQTGSTDPKLFSPELGVVCDRVEGFCADGYGVSIGLTKIFLGTASSEALMRHDRNTTAFLLSNGLYCDTHRRACYRARDRREIDRAWSRRLFYYRQSGL